MSLDRDTGRARLLPNVAELKSSRLSVSCFVTNANTSLPALARSKPPCTPHVKSGVRNMKPSPALCASDGLVTAVSAVVASSQAAQRPDVITAPWRFLSLSSTYARAWSPVNGRLCRVARLQHPARGWGFVGEAIGGQLC